MIEQTSLANGVRVVTDYMPEVRSVTIGFWFACGSRDDQKETAGTAHFIEHMLFKGTSKRTAKQLALEVDYIGGQMNAFTSAEYTCYYIKVLDTHVRDAFDLLSDMLLNSLFLPSDIKKEKQVILQEHDMYEDNPEDLIQDKFFSQVWSDNPLGSNILGSRKTIKKINSASLLHFKKDFYTADNLIVAVAGNIKHQEACKVAEKHLAPLAGVRTQNAKEPPFFQAGSKAIKKETEQTLIIWGLPGLSIHASNWYAANILNNIFGSSASSRLFQHIREEHGLAYFIYSCLNSYSDCGLFTINAGVKPENASALLEMLNEQIEKLCQEGITQAELDKAKEQISSNLLMGLENSSGRMHRLGKMAVLAKPLVQIDEVVSEISKVSLAEVQQAAGQLFSEKKPAVLQLGPTLRKKRNGGHGTKRI